MNEKKESCEILLRQEVVRAFRNGQSAYQYKVLARFVRYWCDRAGDHRLDRVDRTDHRTTKRQTHNRTNTKKLNGVLSSCEKISRIKASWVNMERWRFGVKCFR
jgi:hypothetical protein